MKLFRGGREYLDGMAAKIIKEQVNMLSRTKDHIVFGVCGGRSVGGIFNELGIQPIDWKKVEFFMVDERLAPITSIDSNYKLLMETLSSQLIAQGMITEQQVHAFIDDPSKADHGIGEYWKELKDHGGAFDIALLSSGEDGHIGGIYPKHHSFHSTAEGFLVMHDSPKPPPDRMSMTKQLLLKSTAALLVFYGDGKKDALERFLDPAVPDEQCPAKLVHKIKKRFIFTDINH